MPDIPVVTVDGPSGTGKGTVAGYLAERLGWHLLDSGTLYRVVAYIAQSRAVAKLSREIAAALQQGGKS